MDGNGRSASSALRNERCGSAPSVLEMFDSGREGGSIVKLISLDDMLPRFSAACWVGGGRKLGVGAMMGGGTGESGDECGECGGA